LKLVEVADSSWDDGIAQRRNVQAVKRKAEFARQVFDSVTPHSLVGCAGKVVIHRPLVWEIDAVYNDISFQMTDGIKTYTSDAAATSFDFSVTNTLDQLIDLEVAPTKPTTSDRPYIEVANADLTEDNEFKPSSYSWWIAGTLRIQLGNTNLSNKYGAANGKFTFWTKSESSTEYFDNGTYEIKMTTANSSEVLVYVRMPLDSFDDKLYWDAQVQTDDQNLLGTLTVEFVGLKLEGVPLGDSAPITDVDYIAASSGKRTKLLGSEKWINLFGKVEREFTSVTQDPNFSIGALWNARTAGNVQYLCELVGALKAYSDKIYASSTDGIDNKYVDYGLSGIMDLVEINNYIYSDGPFAGLSEDQIQEVMSMFADDLDLMVDSLEDDKEMGAYLVGRNAAYTSA
jgi:hypothetical protein